MMERSKGARLAVVAAVARNGVIGAEGGLPWRLPSDLKHFKALTMGKPVVMGRRTWESLGKALPGRQNIVVTSRAGYEAPGAAVAASLADALELAAGSLPAQGGEICIIGGGDIYAQAIAMADRLYITHVGAEPEGDTHFPAIEPQLWRVADEQAIDRSERDTAAMRFVTYERAHR